jgi:hypothetical protein
MCCMWEEEEEEEKEEEEERVMPTLKPAKLDWGGPFSGLWSSTLLSIVKNSCGVHAIIYLFIILYIYIIKILKLINHRYMMKH